MARPRVYLAGPEVFLPDAVAKGREKCAVAGEMGLEGVFPLDAALGLSGLSKLEQARRISLANEGLMRSCDALIANLTPFRGVSMDAGTAFEVGFMRALGRPVAGYANVTEDYATRARRFRADIRLPGDCDGPDVDVEDFGLGENLMIEIAVIESGLSVARASVPAGQEMRDLTAFRAALAGLRKTLGVT